jgi:hypothetical protein
MGGVTQGPTAGPVQRFTETARGLGAAAREYELVVPAFRCPPRVAGARRTLRRYPGGVVISVTLRDRPFDEVRTDMVEGVLAANRLEGDAAIRFRTALFEALGAPVPLTSDEARVAERQTRAA